jgi:molecular chaperone GrpE (heat shock protein)
MGEWKNKYYLAYADTQNLRKDLEKDHQTAIKYRAEGFLDALLPGPR